jgi:stage III sporulation protein AA
METIIRFLPKKIAEMINRIPPSQQEEIEEIRIRINRPIEITMSGTLIFLSYIIQPEDAFHLMNKISHFSIYAIEEELKRGYITVSGGHRIGLAGKVILEEGRVKRFRMFHPLISGLPRKEPESLTQSFLTFIEMNGCIP